MMKLFFYWLLQKSKTLKNIFAIHSDNAVKIMVNNIKNSLELNQNRSLRRKWKRITENKNSPFYIYK